MPNLDLIDTVVVLMLENRSFNHLLGYRSLSPWREQVKLVPDGIPADAQGRPAFSNPIRRPEGETLACKAFPLRNPGRPYDDPPHGIGDIRQSLGAPTGGTYPMDGFAQTYADGRARLHPPNPIVTPEQADVMGYMTPEEVPVAHFFAEQYAISDRWFAPLPTSTQPNRLMAYSGFAGINDTFGKSLPDQDTLFDFLTRNRVRSRLYHDGALPFLALMPRYRTAPLPGEHFRSLDQFAYDWHNESAVSFPSVIWIDPAFSDAKALHPNDDHPPVSIWGGQRLMQHVYDVLLTRPDRWKRTVLVVTYDEHGGFFDHVSPPLVKTPCPEGFHYGSFDSLGPRVPAFVVSPLVEPGAVVRPAGDPAYFDHVSILKLLVERWDRGGDPAFAQRVQKRPVASLSTFLTRTVPRTDEPQITWADPASPSARAFEEAAQDLVDRHGHEALGQFPKLWQVTP